MNRLQTFIQEKPCGFLTSAQMPELIALDRLFPVLVRCGNGRFTCAAQDVAHFMRCVEAGGDYVRDVSLPVGSLERAASWVPEVTIDKVKHNAAATKDAGLLGNVPKRMTVEAWHGSDCEEEWRGDADPGL